MKKLQLCSSIVGVFAMASALPALAGQCTSVVWSSSTTYKGGEVITYQGDEYKARYWINPGKTPNKADEWDAWQWLQACSSSQSSAASLVPSSSAQSSSVRSSIAFSSAALSSLAASSIAPSSAATSSGTGSSLATAAQCNWYGNLYPLCKATPSGWGWEEQKSCIARTTCSEQPAPYGVVGAASSAVASSIKSSVNSSVASSIKSSVTSSVASSLKSSSLGTVSSSSLSSVIGTPKTPGFVYATPDGHFGLDGKYFYTNGSNQYFMFYKHPKMVLDVLGDMKNLGMTSLRAWGFCDGEYYGSTDYTGYWDPIFGTGTQSDSHCFQPNNPDKVTAAARFNEVGFKQLDFMLKEAGDRGIKSILPLTNYWGGFGGMCQYAAWSPNIDVDGDGQTTDADEALQCYRVEIKQRYAERFTATTPDGINKAVADYNAAIVNGPQGKEDHEFIVEAAAKFYGDAWSQQRFREYISYVLNRTNHLTGIKYKDDPSIMMWELANEPRCVGCTEEQRAAFHRWIDETSRYIKSIDGKHLVSTGMEGFDASNPWEERQRNELVAQGQTRAQAEAAIPLAYKEGTDFIADHSYPAIDAYSFHLYPDWWGLNEAEAKSYISSRIDKARAGGKPVYLGEFGRMVEFDQAAMYDYQFWDGRQGVSQAERERIYGEWYDLMDAKQLDGAMLWLLSGLDYWERDNMQPWTYNGKTDYGNKTKYCFAPEYEASRTSHPGAAANLNSWTCDGLYNDWDRFTVYCNSARTDVVCAKIGAYSNLLQTQKNTVDGTGMGAASSAPNSSSSTASSAPSRQTIYVSGRSIYLADGTPLVMRGVNLQYGDDPAVKFASIAQIAKTGANVVRLQLRADTTAAQLRSALDEIVRNRMLAMPMYWENGSRGTYQITGGSDANAIDNGVVGGDDAVSKWTETWGAVIKDPKYQPYLLINIANEWGQDKTVWRDTYAKAVKTLRDNGITAPLVIDAGDWGHNPYFFDGGASVLAADPLRNTIFSVHGYYEWSNTAEIDTRMQYLINTQLPVVVGEFGRSNHTAGGKTTDHFYLMQKAQSVSMGWIAWSWRGNGAGETMLDMSNAYDSYSLTQHGVDIVDSATGIKATVVPLATSYFGGSTSSAAATSQASSSSVPSSVAASSQPASSLVSSSSVQTTSSVATSVAPAEMTWNYAANSASLQGAAVLSGDAVELKAAGSGAIWTFNAPMAGEYRLTLTWSTPSGSKVNTLMVDGAGVATNFNSATPATSVRTLMLSQGSHSAGIQVNAGDWGYMTVHSLKVELLGGLQIQSPANFAQLASGSNIQISYLKQGAGKLSYSLNGAAPVSYSGASPLVIPNQGDGIYRLQFGVEGTGLSQSLRLQVGASANKQFVERSGTQFVLGNKPFYFNGSNQYYLMYKPEAMAKDFFERAAHLKMNVVRTWMFCNDTKTHDGVCINMKSNGSFILSKPAAQRTAQEQAIIDRSFQLFDNYVALAEERGIRLVLSLGDHWNYFGNIDSYGGYASAPGREIYKAFITNLLNHTNSITGVAYKNDPTIMMWELANEPRIGSDLPGFSAWVSSIAAHIKSIAPQQLVSIGMESSFGAAGAGDTYANLRAVNSDPNIDAISAHLYPTWWGLTDAQTLGNFDLLADLARDLGKPAYIGEFSWPVNEQRTTGAQTVKLTSFTDQALVDSFVKVSLQQRDQYFASWYAKAWAQRDAIGGMLTWQLSGLEWGNGMTPLGGCQWCSGPYGEASGGWTANNDGFQFYCAINEAELSLSKLGAPGNNVEGKVIHMTWHKPSCDIIKQYSELYQGLNQ
ncbi:MULTISPECIES: cellulase family glycosylhydrolase [unclassified Cellvibrio]|uniref:cellulase family glycosylhydrolase n=1 Tax=unclassified Cellvibrio TaxID=2624793 RepID=UPI00078154A0|nr:MULTISPECIES: cellulase family glycosylhydrolase [unclassified Cellvibrio]QEY17029.1 hypothetical protein D0C16_14215 [Cellvibrio sp. KY-GH-1]